MVMIMHEFSEVEWRKEKNHTEYKMGRKQNYLLLLALDCRRTEN